MEAGKKFISLIEEGKYSEAFDVVKADLFERASTSIDELRKETHKSLGFEIVEEEGEDDDKKPKDDDEDDTDDEDE